MNVDSFKELPLMGILRGISSSQVEPLVEAVVSAGLKTIEITMNTANASDLLADMKKVSAGRLNIGAGTVLSIEDMKIALDAGAQFIVSPTLVDDVVSYCSKNSIPVFPGALTPQEIFSAWNAGAAMVKVFPSNFFGPAYFKEIKGPFDRIELLACGGVSADNLETFFGSGASAAAFGGSVFRKEWLDNGDFSSIENEIRKLVDSFILYSGRCLT
ncbi:MAG: bifunctional 4-hydroxy-2-oxoglutarate aldolase/2-dehydro-3-deoxy-phosphogluconate aldolase [Spirochaetes bacterium]|nr:bifunctional 4-hydroxy-2-oxoglutarate aldolase/2-dehydro-3-deoxy-phosphogluconate aldolase [Spirochaetota bacterium]